MRYLITALLSVTVFAGLAGASWQDTLRVDVELVNVVATVTDSEGRYVIGLRAEDFTVEEEGIPQQVVHFTQDSHIPVSMGIVLDTSASMMRRIETALAAIERFVSTLHEEDDVFFATFADKVRLVQDLTSDRTKLSRALLEARPMGGTSLYDAVLASLDRVARGRHEKRVILLVTDGSDTASGRTLDDALDAVQESRVLVYGLGIDRTQFGEPTEHVRFDLPLRTPPGVPPIFQMRIDERPVDMDVLRDFATASGGQAYRVSPTWTDGTADDIDLVLDEVSAELRNQYSLGYYPSNPAKGRYSRIEVRVRNHGDYSVRARSGYLLP